MANRRVEEQIEQLGRFHEPGPAALQAVRKALRDRVNLVAAKAAKVAAELQLRELLPDLLAAFDRLFENPAERDPQCWGKNAVAKALVDLDFRESAPYLRGARHIQMEPVWGGQQDTAQTLRGTCLLALPACHDIERDDVLRALVDALTEPDAPVRADAVAALGQMEGTEAALVLRLKARVGDEDPQVTGQALEALLRIERDAAIPFAAAFLNAGNEVAEEAALALGSSRLPQALDVLKDAWQHTRSAQFRETLLRGISAIRQPEAMEFLLGLVRSGRMQDARAALEALAIHKASPEIVKQVKEMVGAGRTDLQAEFARLFA
jgi:HEAT repeat protein